MKKSELRWWIRHLQSLYDAAAKRNHGKAIQLYSDLTDLLNYLEGMSDVPSEMNLETACNALAGRLRAV